MPKTVDICVYNPYLGYCLHYWAHNGKLRIMGWAQHDKSNPCDIIKVSYQDWLDLRNYGNPRYANLTLRQYILKMFGGA